MRLSIRIFLWFWLVTLVLTAVLVLSSPWLTRSRPRLEHWQRRAEAAVIARAAEVARAVEQWGPTGVERAGERRRPGTAGHVLLVDARGRELRGQDVPEEAAELARRALASGEEQVARSSALHVAARAVRAPDGRSLAVVALLHRPPGPVDLLTPSALLPRLALLAFVVGLVSLALAAHLSRPLAIVRATAQRLAAGDLAARVGARVAGRRDEVGQLARDFDAMAERLQALVESQRRLVRDVSHELRSPLARLSVAAELARDEAGAAAQGSLDRIELEVGRLDALVGQLLTLARMEAIGDAEREIVDLDAVVTEVGEDAALEASSRGCEVRVEAGGEAAVLSGWPSLLRSAIENVVRNAVRFTAAGTTVEVSLAIEGAEQARRARVRVADRGPGVPPEALERLFEPFFRVEPARERGAGGAGLGLAIAAAAVRAHQGVITAANRAGGGLEVEISVPIASGGVTF